MAENLLGTDIAFSNFEITSPYGDADLISGRKCLIQDLILRLMTPRGDLWCHPDYGVSIQQFIHAEGTAINQLDLTQTIKAEILNDPRVKSADVIISQWDGYAVKCTATIQPIDDTNPINLVIGYDLAQMSMEVVAGV